MKIQLRSTQEKIDEIVRRVVNQFHSEKIIIFGFHAKVPGGLRCDTVCKGGVGRQCLLPQGGTGHECTTGGADGANRQGAGKGTGHPG